MNILLTTLISLVMTYEMPKLPYANNGLEPIINTKLESSSTKTENTPTEKTHSTSMPYSTKRPTAYRCWTDTSLPTIMNIPTW